MWVAPASSQLRDDDAGGTETGHNEPFYGVHTQSFEFTTAIRYRTYLRQRQTFGNYIATACWHTGGSYKVGWRAVGAAAEGQNISTSLGRCRFVTGDDDDNDDASNKRRFHEPWGAFLGRNDLLSNSSNSRSIGSQQIHFMGSVLNSDNCSQAGSAWVWQRAKGDNYDSGA